MSSKFNFSTFEYPKLAINLLLNYIHIIQKVKNNMN